MNYTLLNKILEISVPAIIVTVLPVLTTLVGVLVVRAKNWLEAKLGAEEYHLAEAFAKQAVLFAEQSGLNSQLVKEVCDKKALATATLQAWLTQYNIRIDVAYLSGLIEAEVYKLNAGKKSA